MPLSHGAAIVAPSGPASTTAAPESANGPAATSCGPPSARLRVAWPSFSVAIAPGSSPPQAVRPAASSAAARLQVRADSISVFMPGKVAHRAVPASFGRPEAGRSPCEDREPRLTRSLRARRMAAPLARARDLRRGEVVQGAHTGESPMSQDLTVTIAGGAERASELLTLYEIGDDDLLHVRALGRHLAPQIDAIIDEFYVWMKARSLYDQFFSDEELFRQTRDLQTDTWKDFFVANVDQDYVRRRQVIGKTHARIGLPLQAYLGAMNQFLSMFPGARAFEGDGGRRIRRRGVRDHQAGPPRHGDRRGRVHAHHEPAHRPAEPGADRDVHAGDRHLAGHPDAADRGRDRLQARDGHHERDAVAHRRDRAPRSSSSTSRAWRWSTPRWPTT